MSINTLNFSDSDIINALKRELERREDPLVALDIYNMGSPSLKVSLIKLCNFQKETLIHILANKALAQQNEQIDNSILIQETLNILKTEELKKDLKEIVTATDKDDLRFLDYATVIRNEKLNFIYQILKLIPKKDRASCKNTDSTEDFHEELEGKEIGILFSLFILSKDKNSFIKNKGPKDVTLLHILGEKIIENQEKKQDISYLLDIARKILKTKSLKKDLKDIVTAIDKDSRCFLDYAVLFRDEKLNFIKKVLKVIPIEDREECLKLMFQIVLKNDDLNTALALFDLSNNSEKTMLSKIQSPKKMTLIQMLITRIYQDLRKNDQSDFLKKPIEVLEQIDPKDRKEIANLQNSMGRNVFHLAAICKDKEFNLFFEILKIIPQQDRADCLKTQDSLQRWTPLHSKANATTHEGNLNEISIQNILDLLPSEKDKEDLQKIKDNQNKSYIEIQEKKKQSEEFHKKNDKEATNDNGYLESKRKAGLAAVIANHKKAERKPVNFKILLARKRSQSAPNILPKTHRGVTVADFSISQKRNEKEPISEKESESQPNAEPTALNFFESLQNSIYDDLK